MQKNNTIGRSMIEMIAVLAIMGVLSVGIFAAVRYALDLYKANQITKEALSQGAYLTLRKLPEGEDLLKDYKASISYETKRRFSGDYLEIQVLGVSQSVCKKILNQSIPDDSILNFVESNPSQGTTTGDNCALTANQLVYFFEAEKEEPKSSQPEPETPTACLGEAPTPCHECVDGQWKNKCSEGKWCDEVNGRCESCPAGQILVDGECAQVKCTSGTDNNTHSYTCFIKDQVCGSLCTNKGEDCSYGVCDPTECPTGELTFDISGLGAVCQDKKGGPTCIRRYEGGNYSWTCLTQIGNEWVQCCGTDVATDKGQALFNLFGKCQYGTCSNICASETSFKPVIFDWTYGCSLDNVGCRPKRQDGSNIYWECVTPDYACNYYEDKCRTSSKPTIEEFSNMTAKCCPAPESTCPIETLPNGTKKQLTKGELSSGAQICFLQESSNKAIYCNRLKKECYITTYSGNPTDYLIVDGTEEKICCREPGSFIDCSQGLCKENKIDRQSLGSEAAKNVKFVENYLINHQGSGTQPETKTRTLGGYELTLQDNTTVFCTKYPQGFNCFFNGNACGVGCKIDNDKIDNNEKLSNDKANPNYGYLKCDNVTMYECASKKDTNLKYCVSGQSYDPDKPCFCDALGRELTKKDEVCCNTNEAMVNGGCTRCLNGRRLNTTTRECCYKNASIMDGVCTPPANSFESVSTQEYKCNGNRILKASGEKDSEKIDILECVCPSLPNNKQAELDSDGLCREPGNSRLNDAGDAYICRPGTSFDERTGNCI